jgi:glutaredoxin
MKPQSAPGDECVSTDDVSRPDDVGRLSLVCSIRLIISSSATAGNGHLAGRLDRGRYGNTSRLISPCRPFIITAVGEGMMRERPVVTIYSKPGCHLCEEAKQAIMRSGCPVAFRLEIVNIEEDAQLYARFKDDIPVIFINGLKAFKHRVTPREFCDRLCRVIQRTR